MIFEKQQVEILYRPAAHCSVFLLGHYVRGSNEAYCTKEKKSVYYVSIKSQKYFTGTLHANMDTLGRVYHEIKIRESQAIKTDLPDNMYSLFIEGYTFGKTQSNLEGMQSIIILS